MHTLYLFFILLGSNLLAIGFGLAAFHTNTVNHFAEDGYITTISVIQLLAICLLVICIHFSHKKETASSLWLVIAFGFFFLAADELFQIHENLDNQVHQLLYLQESAFTDRLDDLLVGLYGVTGFWLCFLLTQRALAGISNPFLILFSDLSCFFPWCCSICSPIAMISCPWYLRRNGGSSAPPGSHWWRMD